MAKVIIELKYYSREEYDLEDYGHEEGTTWEDLTKNQQAEIHGMLIADKFISIGDVVNIEDD